MLISCVKYFFFVFSCCFVSKKLHKSTFSVKTVLFNTVYSFVCAIVCSLPNIMFVDTNGVLPMCLSLGCLLIYNYFIIKNRKLETLITYTVISCGLSYAVEAVAILLVGPAVYFIGDVKNQTDDNTISAILCLCEIIKWVVQLLLCFLFFKIKRFKNGLVNYDTQLSSETGLFISIWLFTLGLLFSVKGTGVSVFIIAFFVTLSLIFAIFFWWRKHIKNIYLEKIRNRNLEIAEISLEEQLEKSELLEADNEAMSKIIHRDNKLIPAMQSAVEEILSCKNADEQIKKASELLPQLKSMSGERKGLISSYEADYRKLPETGVFSLDSALSYLNKKAGERDICFNVSVNTDIKDFVRGKIDETDLNTLVLDITENALIASSQRQGGNILVVFSDDDSSLKLSVFDNGENFAVNVIANSGKKRITTHKKTGGSGIGLMTAFELLKKNRATFEIDELINSSSFSKSVSIIFGSEYGYRIKTHRPELIDVIKRRGDITLIEA